MGLALGLRLMIWLSAIARVYYSIWLEYAVKLWDNALIFCLSTVSNDKEVFYWFQLFVPAERWGLCIRAVCSGLSRGPSSSGRADRGFERQPVLVQVATNGSMYLRIVPYLPINLYIPISDNVTQLTIDPISVSRDDSPPKGTTWPRRQGPPISPAWRHRNPFLHCNGVRCEQTCKHRHRHRHVHVNVLFPQHDEACKQRYPLASEDERLYRYVRAVSVVLTLASTRQ
jgi:hypothetical protein